MTPKKSKNTKAQKQPKHITGNVLPTGIPGITSGGQPWINTVPSIFVVVPIKQMGHSKRTDPGAKGGRTERGQVSHSPQLESVRNSHTVRTKKYQKPPRPRTGGRTATKSFGSTHPPEEVNKKKTPPTTTTPTTTTTTTAATATNSENLNA